MQEKRGILGGEKNNMVKSQPKKGVYMKCKNCRYLNKDTFENTTLHTCNMFYYLIQRWNKTYQNKHIYSVSSLRGEDDECIIKSELQKLTNK